jgi:hypothetical protein
MNDIDIDRRLLLLAPLLSALAVPAAQAGQIDRNETFVLPAPRIAFEPWGSLPPRSGEMAKLYGDFDKPGPYLVMMKWYPGFFSAPHSYATDRIQVVVAGTWWVNSGPDFTPRDAVPVAAGGFVKRIARTPHYDGVPRGGHEPAVIAVFGIGPVDIRLVDAGKPSWRRA